MALVACGAYTVKNDLGESIKVGETVVSSGECAEFGDGLFGFGSDWPQTITKEDGSAVSADSDAEEEWPAANYLVNAEGVTEADEACEVGEEEPADEGDKATEGDKVNVNTAENCTAQDSGGTWIPVNTSCSCPIGKVFNTETGKCAVDVNTAENCTAADSGGTWSEQDKTCTCTMGKTVNAETGKCASVKTAENCTGKDSGGTWSPATNTCSCPTGSILSIATGKCVANTAP